MIRAAVATVLAIVALVVGQPATAQAPARPRPAPTVTRPPHQLQPIRYALLPLGDSITSGTASTDGTGYRAPLARLAPQATYAGSQGAAPLWHEGHPGWTIDQLAAITQTTVALYRPAYVLVHAGTNDDGLGRSGVEMLASMGRLLDAVAAGSPGSLVLVAQIPLTPYNTPTQQAQEAAYDDGLPGLVVARPWVRVVDMRGTEISADGVHPDDAGYAHMAAVWAAELPEVRKL